MLLRKETGKLPVPRASAKVTGPTAICGASNLGLCPYLPSPGFRTLQHRPIDPLLIYCFACGSVTPGLLDGGLKFRPMTLPDRYIEHGDYRDQLAMAGLTAQHIASTALTTLGRAKDAAKFSLSALSPSV